MFELFLLSKLLHRPMHGYLIQTILNAAIGPFRRLSWGTLYPLIRRLEQTGLIEAVEEGGVDPRGKRQYRTTESGRLRLLELLRSGAGSDADYPAFFRLKLGCFGHIDREAQRAIVMDYRGYQEQIRDHSKLMRERIVKEAGDSSIEMRSALLGLEHQRTGAECELRWVDGLLERLAEERGRV